MSILLRSAADGLSQLVEQDDVEQDDVKQDDVEQALFQ